MKRTTDNCRSRKTRKQSIPAARRHPRGVSIGGQTIVLRDKPVEHISIAQYAMAAMAPFLRIFNKGDRNG